MPRGLKKERRPATMPEFGEMEPRVSILSHSLDRLINEANDKGLVVVREYAKKIKKQMKDLRDLFEENGL